MLELYADYPGNYFEPSQLESGLYYGTYAEGRLVAIAGTHVLAPAESIAVLGNIVTSASARRATTTTSASRWTSRTCARC